jgi:mono/diheme cytochrome c family protein
MTQKPMTQPQRLTLNVGAASASLLLVAFLIGSTGDTGTRTDPSDPVQHGRFLVISHACGDCHGGGSNPAAPGFLAGYDAQTWPLGELPVGEFRTFARNITPHNATGLGRFSERQIFNALRYGLRPGETADVEITSGTPGMGNFPQFPKYLAPSMPWHSWRHMPDEDLRAIAAYLKRGLKPVEHQVPDSEGPPDFWAGFAAPEMIGTYPAAPFPTANEVAPAGAGAGGNN